MARRVAADVCGTWRQRGARGDARGRRCGVRQGRYDDIVDPLRGDRRPRSAGTRRRLRVALPGAGYRRNVADQRDGGGGRRSGGAHRRQRMLRPLREGADPLRFLAGRSRRARAFRSGGLCRRQSVHRVGDGRWLRRGRSEPQGRSGGPDGTVRGRPAVVRRSPRQPPRRQFLQHHRPAADRGGAARAGLVAGGAGARAGAADDRRDGARHLRGARQGAVARDSGPPPRPPPTSGPPRCSPSM